MIGRFLREFGSERHADERLAMRWHYGHVFAYGLVTFFYLGAICWHLAAAGRHRRAAEALARQRCSDDPPRFI